MPEINMKKMVTVQAKTLRVYMKVSDEFRAQLLDQDGEEIFNYEGYVPEFMPGDDSDYLSLNINLDTGEIMNWAKVAGEDIEKWIEAKE